jgi:hypothetical protein
MPDGYSSVLAELLATPAAVTGTTQTTLVGPGALWQRPGGFHRFPGKTYRLTAKGIISNIVTTPGTLQFTITDGPTANIAAWQSQAISLNTTAKTNVYWQINALIRASAIGTGTTATLIGMGNWTSESAVGATAGQPLDVGIPASGAPAAGTGFDSTVAGVVDFQAKFSLTGNSIQCFEYILESVN